MCTRSASRHAAPVNMCLVAPHPPLPPPLLPSLIKFAIGFSYICHWALLRKSSYLVMLSQYTRHRRLNFFINVSTDLDRIDMVESFSQAAGEDSAYDTTTSSASTWQATPWPATYVQEAIALLLAADGSVEVDVSSLPYRSLGPLFHLSPR